MPRRSGYPRVDEVESRGWGRRAPQSPSSSSFGAPQGNNEIYTYDVVFSPGEARKKNQGITPFPYKITKDISQPQVTAPIRRLQVISSLYCKYAEAARDGTGCHGILVPAAQSRDCKPIINKPCRGQFPRQGLEKIQRMESPPMMVSVTWSVWSRTTMSASMPGARIPFFRCPMILAGVADAIFTAS